MLESIIFWVFATLSVLAALGVIFHRSIIYSALLLIVVFLSIAAFFVLNNADFLAIAQTIIYGVGLTIILLFGIMFTGDKPFERGMVGKSTHLLYGFIAVMTGALLIRAIAYHFPLQTMSPSWVNTLQTQGTTFTLGQQLFTTQMLSFELASILLTVAMMGAIAIAKKQFGNSLKGRETEFVERDESIVDLPTREMAGV